MWSRRRCTRSTTRGPAPQEWVERLTAAAEEGGASLLVSGVDPGWGNDALAVIAAGLCTRIRSIHCQEIFDYSTYNQPYAVKVSCGFGQPMGREDPVPMMLLPSIPTMVWGGNIRLIARGLGLEIDEITEEVERLPLEESIDTVMGRFEKGTQGAFWLKVIGKSGGRERIVIDHITRIHPSCAPDWPQPDEGVGDHRVIVDGDPQLTILSRADVPGGTRADGGNTTAANRLLGALNWLADQKPRIYDGLDVPMQSALPPEVEATRWADYEVGLTTIRIRRGCSTDRGRIGFRDLTAVSTRRECQDGVDEPHRSEPHHTAGSVRAFPFRRHRDRRGGGRHPGGAGGQHVCPCVARPAAGVVLCAEHLRDVAEAEGSALSGDQRARRSP